MCATVAEQGALADAGLTGQQHDLAGDQPAAEDPVELGEPGQLARGPLGDDLRERAGGVLAGSSR